MAEYIDREALIQNIDEGFDKTDPCGEEQIGFLKCRRIAREIPSADVAQVRHGRWVAVENEEQTCDEWDCTACGQRRTFLCEMDADDMKEHYPYCPNCGAKMDVEDNHDSDGI